MKKFTLFIIRIYQKTLSFDHGIVRGYFPNGYCRFYPTCSEYSYQAIDQYGMIQGGKKAFKRIVSCHPFHPGGYDPVQKNSSTKNVE